MKRRRHALALMFGLLPVAWIAVSFRSTAQEPSQTREPEQIKSLDLVFRIDDLGGKVQDLEIKETGQEIRIELAADVLFDFDKADIRPAAQSALRHAGELSHGKGKGAIRIEGHTDS